MSTPASSQRPRHTLSRPGVELVAASTFARPAAAGQLLRRRLRTLLLFVLLALFLWVLRTPFIEPPTYLTGQLVALGILGGFGILLWSDTPLSPTQLRAFELTIVAVTVGRLLWLGYSLLRDAAIAGADTLALAEMYNLVVPICALMLAYGMFVPNTWRRAALVMAPIAATPLVVLVALRRTEPEASATLDVLGEVNALTAMGLMLILAMVIGVAGTHVIYSLRTEAQRARQLGQYRLQELIASGGMGEVWKASHQFLARPAAVKVIHPEKIDPANPEAAAVVLHRFQLEAQATAELESLHTVEIYDFGTTDEGDFYYAMELLNGLDLEVLVRRFGPLPTARVAHFLLQACDSLAEAHDRGHIHRDVKPANLFTCKIGRAFDVIKVLDFGLVTRAGSEATRDLRLDEQAEMAGTPAYMAPEQVLAKTQIDRRADIYSLGCVAYWLLTGHLLFDIDRPIAMAVAHVKAMPMPPSRRTEIDIPRDFERIVLDCLEKNPDARPQTVEILADRITATSTASGWGQKEAREWWERHRPLELVAEGSNEA